MVVYISNKVRCGLNTEDSKEAKTHKNYEITFEIKTILDKLKLLNRPLGYQLVAL